MESIKRRREMIPKMDSGIIAGCSEERAAELTVESVGTHLYFYSEVTPGKCLELIKKLKETDEMLRNERLSRSIPNNYERTPIWLHIMSAGGDLFAALSIADQLATIKTPVFSIVEGYAASAATIISMVCSRRYIMPSAFMMVHELSSIAWGKYSEMQDDMHILDMLMETVTNFYAAHSCLSKKRIRKLLRRDSWFDAAAALEAGFVDEVMK